MDPFRFRQGARPLLISMPHVGTHLPDALARRMMPIARTVPDTDWHLEQLYDFADALGASVLAGTHSRYVVDLNRPPDNANLYPGQDTTGLCPIDTFAKQPIYRMGEEPDDTEIRHRVGTYWKPYHAKLQEELARISAVHGSALLWDAHSIASRVPRFFPGRLTDFNLGTADGASCRPEIGTRMQEIAQGAAGFTSVLNGRFKGGYITRTYGKPSEGVDAVQLELSEITYMDEPHPFAYRRDLAAEVQPHLRAMLEAMLGFHRA
ncbi:MAG: N-formylglutamate deformylase [Betaproteobacteria bacterium]